jgi:hypothetical protein
MNTAISDKQIKELFNNKANVMSYDSIKQHNTLKSLLAPYGFCILLYVWSDNNGKMSGHWVAIKYHKNSIIMFDSLGNDDCDLLKDVSYPVAVRNHEDYPYLSKLIMDSNIPCYYNPYQIQQDGSAVCARYSCHFVRNIDKYKSLTDYLKLFTKDKKKNDELILHLTQNYF